MSSITANSIPPTNNAVAPPANVWNRGPPSQPNSGTSSPHVNGAPQHPAPNGITVNLNGNGTNGSAPVPVGHSRKGSLMVGGGMDIKRGNIAFGTVDSPNPHLSSSPAAPSMTGTHLADQVKSFGSIEADSTDPNSVKAPSRKMSSLNDPSNPTGLPAPKKQLDIHAMFAGKPNQPAERRQSMGQGVPQQGLNGPQFNQQQFRPPSAQRSPPINPAMINYGQMPRPGGNMPYGMPQGQYQPQFPPQGYYPYYGQPPQNSQQPMQPYNMPQQWAPNHHPQNAQMMGARGVPHPVPSPALAPTGLPNNNGPSPHHTPQSRPPTLAPSTPSRPPQAPSFTPGASSFTPNSSSFTPNPVFSMSTGATAFTPRASKAIKIARPDGTEVDLKDVAKPVSNGASTPQTPPVDASTPNKKPYTLPVVVRLESEEQKKERMKEEAEREKIRAIEEAEAKERKERKERQAKEAEEKRLADEKAKADQAAKEQAEAEEVAKKAAEEEQAKAKAEQEKVDKDAAEKAAEAAQAAEKPSTSTPSSPATSIAGLPPKPITVDSPALTEVTEEPHSALTLAQPISDLSTITYPASVNPPTPGLNDNAESGKYRYDRSFLLQFMQVCKEKPESLPSLEDIGLEADTSSGFGTRGARGSARPPPTRGAPAGLGIGGMGRPTSGMGTFAMGNFGSVRGTTSEDRYQRSLSQGGRQATTRPMGQGGMQGLPPMGASSSRGGSRSQRGGPRQRQPPPSFATEPDVAPLAVSQNSWVKARPTDNDESSPAYVERKVKSLLNKLTQEKFDSISKQILEWANRSKNETDGMSLKLVIKQVFEKATDEAHWSAMYGRLCRKLLDDLDPAVTEIIDGKPLSGGVLFRKYLIGRCQMDFEAGWKARELAVNAAAAKSLEDQERLAKAEQDKEAGKEEEAAMLSDEYYAAQKAKRRGLGLVQLVGELYKLEMISTKVIRTCLVTLLSNLTDPDEEDIESTCKLLTTVGGQYEAQVPESMGQVMQRMNAILGLPGTSSRLRFMIMDIVDLQRHGWKSKKTQSSVMTIAEIHQQAAKEQAQKTAHAAQSSRESMSRGGSRAGRQRDGSDWQSVQQPVRLPQRPADMSNLGKLATSGAAPTFAGPSSVFSKRGKPAAATPPLSRQTSTVNMFSALNDAPEPAAEAASERPKLNLKPRSVPMPGEEKQGDEEEVEEEEEEVEEKAPAVMSEDAAKIKIASDMKELWGEKDVGGSRNPEDIVEYYKALPTERQHLLSLQLIDEAFRLSKYKDAEIIAKGLKLAQEQGAATVEVLKQGLDDDSIDFPQAYKAIALFIRSLSLPDDEISALLAKVDVYGEPRITPKDKLDKALAAVDEEAKVAA